MDLLCIVIIAGLCVVIFALIWDKSSAIFKNTIHYTLKP